MLGEPTGRGAVLKPGSYKQEGLVRNGTFKGSLRCSDHGMVESKIVRAARRVYSITAPDFGRAGFGLFRDLLGRLLWNPLERTGTQEFWLIFKDHFLQGQE